MKNEPGSRTSRPGRKIVYAWWRIWPRSRRGPVWESLGFLARRNLGCTQQKMGDPWGLPVQSYGLRLKKPYLLTCWYSPATPRFLPNSIFSFSRQMVRITVRPLSHRFWSVFFDWPPMFGPKTNQPSVDEARKHCGDTILDPRGSSRWGVTVLAKSQSSWQNILATFSPMFVGYFIFPNVLSLVSFVWHRS